MNFSSSGFLAPGTSAVPYVSCFTLRSEASNVLHLDTASGIASRRIRRPSDAPDWLRRDGHPIKIEGAAVAVRSAPQGLTRTIIITALLHNGKLKPVRTQTLCRRAMERAGDLDWGLHIADRVWCPVLRVCAGTLAWIDNREFPGGPIGYEIAHYAGAQITVPNAFGIVTGWLADGFLLYRCLVIFHMRLHIIALPVLIFLTGVATGILFLFQSTRPGASLWNKTSVNFGVIYFSLSAGLNVIISSLITWHLLSFRRSVKRALGPGHAALGSYGSIAAMVTESSLMYAVVAVMLVVPYGIGSHVSSLFLAPWTQFQILSPMLIILRVAKRRAWNSHTDSTVTTLRFQDHRRGATTQTTDTEKDGVDGIHVHLQPEGKTQSGSAIAPSSTSAYEEA
ncbi:hypothetical protein EVG20_g6486 [Dentipellis fragilis]|uniref:Uncharacterized protein n=1 Tax=Dentipellis fragilis TaxID=205917 RepID=A0A4Y9YMM0_9AGAM|nr:hypothetical protein EVG20_g6486 [Dentipellis fragilis]